MARLVCARLQGNCDQPQSFGDLAPPQIEELAGKFKKSVPQTYEKLREVESWLRLQPTPEPPNIDQVDPQTLVHVLKGKLPNSPAARRTIQSLQRMIRN